MKVIAYIREDGSRPFRSWIESLDVQAKFKIQLAISKLELGNVSAIKWIRGIGEVRLDWGPGYRIYLAQDGPNLIVLFGGGTKQRQSADITRAIALCSEYKRRKDPKGKDK